MKLIAILLLFGICQTCFCSSVYIEEINRVGDLSSEDDRMEAIYYSSKKILAQIATEYNLDHDKYFEIKSKKFEELFLTHEKLWLLNIYGHDSLSALPPELQTTAQDQIKKIKKDEEIKYGRLFEFIDEIKFLREEVKEEQTYAQLEINVDKDQIKGLIEQTLKFSKSNYSEVLMLLDIHYEGPPLLELNLKSKGQLAAPILETIKQKISEKSSVPLVLCKRYCQNYYSKWIFQKSSSNELFEMRFNESLFLKIVLEMRNNFNIDKTKLNSSIRGRIVLQDIETKEILSTREVLYAQKTFEQNSQINSNLATFIFNLVFPEVERITQVFNRLKGHNHFFKLSVQDFHNFDQLIELLGVLNLNKRNKSTSITIDSFNQTNASLNVAYNGKEKIFSDVFKSLKELKLSQGTKIIYEFDGIQDVLKFVKSKP